MTLLVKNEEDMLEDNLIFHHAMGIDAFIITDNNSTDHTPDIIQKYKAKGWIVESIKENGTDYQQKKWVDRMILIADKKYQADWIINADADEFWYYKRGIKAILNHTRANVLQCHISNVYPTQGQPWQQWDKTVRDVPQIQQYDLSPFSIFNKQGVKVMHRTAGYLQISMGNHKVSMLPKRQENCHLRIYHYNIRTKDHFMQKMVNGGQQLEKRKNKHGGRHWRYFYELYKKNLLEQEYQRVIGARHYQSLSQRGYICQDNPIPQYLAKIKEKQALG